MKWLSDNSSALNLIASLLLVCVTVAYVRLTATLSQSASRALVEAKHARLDARMPSVTAKADARRVAPTKVRVEVSLRNWGSVPARVHLQCPEGWGGPVTRDLDELTSLYATIPPGESIDPIYEAPIDPSVPIALGLARTHLQSLDLDLTVSPLEGGVFDYYTWGVHYDPSTDEVVQEPHRFFLHEWRKYPGVGEP
jgi:hypothetical protein